MNTHFLSTLQWHIVLTLSIWIPFQPRTMLYHRPQDCSTPGQIVLLWRKLNVLLHSSGSDQNWTLSMLQWHTVLTGST